MMMDKVQRKEIVAEYSQGWPLGGMSGALAPDADFERELKRRSLPGHTLIHSTVAWRRRSRYN
jgi:hypothetical protein